MGVVLLWDKPEVDVVTLVNKAKEIASHISVK
jgi:hypothetical protein